MIVGRPISAHVRHIHAFPSGRDRRSSVRVKYLVVGPHAGTEGYEKLGAASRSFRPALLHGRERPSLAGTKTPTRIPSGPKLAREGHEVAWEVIALAGRTPVGC